MTLAEGLRIYDINITVDEFLLYCLIALIGYGLLVGLYTYMISTLEHFKTKRMFIKYELPRLHKRKLQKSLDENKTQADRIKLLEKEVEKYFIKLKTITDATEEKNNE